MRTKTLVIAVTTALLSSGAALAQVKGPDTGIEGAGQSNNPLGPTLPGYTCSGQGGSNCSAAIADGSGSATPGPTTTSTFSISGCGEIRDVDIGLDVTHTWVGDLSFTVRSPDNTPVTVYDRPGVPASLFGCSGDNIFAVLDDWGTDPVEDTCFVDPAIEGLLIPNNPLAAFNGLSADGTWTIEANDNAGGDTGTLNDWSVDVYTATCGQPEGEIPIARFPVTKSFDDNNPAEVEVTLSCNTGLPLVQSQTITGGALNGVTFIVTDFENGVMDCTVTETAGVGGYATEYDNGFAVTEDACSFVNVGWENVWSCEISNGLLPVDVEVIKWWVDENPQFDAVNYAEAVYGCNNEQFGIDASGSLEFFGDGAIDGFSVYPDWDGSTNCWVMETVVDSGVEFDDSECASLSVLPGQGASCAIYNTRLYEGIPTLSQYGLGLLALLMLGLGFVAYRRIV